MNKIFNKIFGLYLVIIISLTGIILLIVADVVHEHYLKTITNDLKMLNYSVREQLKDDILDNNIINLQSKIGKLKRIIKVRITVIDTEGNVLSDSDESPSLMENHAARVEIAQAMSGRIGTALRYSNTVHKKMLYVATPVKKFGLMKAVVRVSLYVDHIDRLYSDIRNEILFATVIILIISVILLFYFSKHITNPINEIVEASQKLAEGDFNPKVFIKNNDELKDLANNFNKMTEKIRGMFENQSMQQEELKRIISAMQEGLIVLDKDNKIILHNKSFKKTVNANEINDKFYWEVLRDGNVQKLVDKVRRKKSRKTAEIKLDKVYYLCSANYIQAKDEIVLVLFDISERKQLEEMKKEFIINASHELRTPLTAIHGFVETMMQEAKDVGFSKYLEIIKRHTTRLIMIVEDMLKISKMEDDRISLELSLIDFKELIEDVMTIFQERLKAKRLKFSYDIAKGIREFQGDYFKIEQLVINLIDNAIKYTQSGEIRLNLRDDEENNLIIEVADTGIGIPQQDLDRIFERFYTVDKSRSRRNGGTGLGLSIVKHIVNLHKGNIKVKSSESKGSTFLVTLPRERE